MLTQFRIGMCALALLAGVWAGSASAQWPWSANNTNRLEPHYGGVCEDCDLSGRVMAGARMTNSVFSRSDFSGASLARANAARSRFDEANFSGADLRHANGEDADFSRATFAEAEMGAMNLDGARIAGADLRRARGLTQAQLDEACGDRRTRVPRGLRVRRC